MPANSWNSSWARVVGLKWIMNAKIISDRKLDDRRQSFEWKCRTWESSTNHFPVFAFDFRSLMPNQRRILIRKPCNATIWPNASHQITFCCWFRSMRMASALWQIVLIIHDLRSTRVNRTKRRESWIPLKSHNTMLNGSDITYPWHFMLCVRNAYDFSLLLLSPACALQNLQRNHLKCHPAE